MRSILLASCAVILVANVAACSSATTVDAGGDGAPGDTPNDVQTLDGADVADATDVGPDIAQDSGPPGLTGTWRLTTLTIMGDGGTGSVHDTDTPIMVGGGTVHARVNGLLALTNASFAFGLDLLVSATPPPDHLAVDQNAVMMGMPRLNANGIGSAGTLDTSMNRFVGVSSGGSAITIPLTPNPDGTLTVAPFGTNIALTYSLPAAPLSGSATLTSNGEAISIPVGAGMSYLPFTNPRAVILWDRPNAGTGYTPSNDTSISIAGSPPSSAPYAMTFSGMPPADAIATLGGVPVALGYVIIYDDTSGNMQLDLTGSDTIRGISTVAIAWRGAGTPDGTFATSPVANLLDGGYQTVTLIGYVPSSGTPYLAAMPNDPTDPVNLDAPIFNAAVMVSRIPDVL